MKKLIFSLTAGLVICTAGFTSYKIYDNYHMSKLNPLMAENLEALTQNENGGGSKSCYKTIDTNKTSADPDKPFDVIVCGADGRCSSTISVYWAMDPGKCD
jgi:hypothetical protein